MKFFILTILFVTCHASSWLYPCHDARRTSLTKVEDFDPDMFKEDQWNVTLPVGVTNPIVDSSGVIYIGSSFDVEAYDAITGTKKWKTLVPNQEIQAQVYLDEVKGVLYTCNLQSINCLNSNDGTLLWSIKLDLHNQFDSTQCLKLPDRDVVLLWGEGRITAFDLNNKTILWEAVTEIVEATVVASSDVIAIVGRINYLFYLGIIDMSIGNLTIMTPTTQTIQTSDTQYSVMDKYGCTYVAYQNNNLQTIDKFDKNGSLIWSQPMGKTQTNGQVVMTALDDKEYICGMYISHISTIVVCMNITDGSLIWEVEVSDDLDGCHTMVIDDNYNLYISSFDYLYMIDVRTGDQLLKTHISMKGGLNLNRLIIYRNTFLQIYRTAYDQPPIPILVAFQSSGVNPNPPNHTTDPSRNSNTPYYYIIIGCAAGVIIGILATLIIMYLMKKREKNTIGERSPLINH